MNFLADESCAGPVIRALREAGHDVVAVAEVAKGATDEQVLERALNEKRVLITEDPRRSRRGRNSAALPPTGLRGSFGDPFSDTGTTSGLQAADGARTPGDRTMLNRDGGTNPASFLLAQGGNIGLRESIMQARINKRTYTSKKGNQVRMDQFGIGLHLSEDSRQSASQLCLIGEVPIVGSVLPCVLPQPFRGV
jgi:hypothetical protein